MPILPEKRVQGDGVRQPNDIAFERMAAPDSPMSRPKPVVARPMPAQASPTLPSQANYRARAKFPL